jgi:hypothetical protein
MKAMTIVAGIVCAVAALWLAVATHLDVSMAGFPDGHITDYGHAVDVPLRIVSWVAVGIGVVFLGLSFSRISARTRTVGLLVAVAALVVVALAAEVGIPWYFGTHLALDNGIGG